MTQQTTIDNDTTRQRVRERYSKIAVSNSDCGCSTSCCADEDGTKQASAAAKEAEGCGCGPSCCTDDNKAATRAAEIGYTAEELAALPDGADMGLSCGNPVAIAQLKPGETVLDLGSGGGFDCFIAAKRVGPTGRVIGVDMTPEMISAARRNAQKGDFANVEFRLGEIEALPVGDSVVDAILSNCVINLSPDKPAVFREAYRVLKKGGRLSIADIVATQPLPDELRKDFAAYTSCLAGAALVDDLETMIKDAGFSQVRITLKEETRAIINNWSESGQAGNYVVSALIEAIA